MTKELGQESGDATSREAIRALFHSLPEAYPECLDALKRLERTFRMEIAAALEPSLNSYLRQVPQETLADKQTLTTKLNADLHDLGLCPLSPSGKPSILVADAKDRDHAHISRFRFQRQDKHGKMVRDGTCTTLDQLQLMPTPPRRETFARYYGSRKSHDRAR